MPFWFGPHSKEFTPSSNMSNIQFECSYYMNDRKQHKSGVSFDVIEVIAASSVGQLFNASPICDRRYFAISLSS